MRLSFGGEGFKAGEFNKLYKKVADTIDFILYSRDELDSINRAISQLKARGADIEVECVERNKPPPRNRAKFAAHWPLHHQYFFRARIVNRFIKSVFPKDKPPKKGVLFNRLRIE
jgi:hypothetical protein